MNNQGWPTRTIAQSETGNQKGQNGMNKRMALARRLIPVVVAVAVLVGALGMAPAAHASSAHADNCAYSGNWALCPDATNSGYYLYQAYNGQWYRVGTVWVRSGWTYLSSSGVTIAKNDANGQTWIRAATGWLNITGMSTQAVNNALVANNMSNNQVRLTQVMLGYTSMPYIPIPSLMP